MSSCSTASTTCARRRPPAAASCSRRRTTPNPEFAVQGLAAAGVKVFALVEPLQPPELGRLMRSLRAVHGHEYQAVSFGAIKNAIAWLRGGGVVAILVDRDIQKRGVEIEFCGYPAKFPTGAVDLAMRTGSVLIPGWVRRTGGFRVHAAIGPPMPLIMTGNTDDDLRINSARLLALFEQHLRQDPGQWSVLDRIWPDDIEAAQSAAAPTRQWIARRYNDVQTRVRGSRRSLKAARVGIADLHIHTRYGDGMATVPELLEYVEHHTRPRRHRRHRARHLACRRRSARAARPRRLPVRVICGEEITTLDGHLIALDIDAPLPELPPHRRDAGGDPPAGRHRDRAASALVSHPQRHPQGLRTRAASAPTKRSVSMRSRNTT